MQEPALEYFEAYFGDSLNEDTSDEDIMESVQDLIELRNRVCEAVGIDEVAPVYTAGKAIADRIPKDVYKKKVFDVPRFRRANRKLGRKMSRLYKQEVEPIKTAGRHLTGTEEKDDAIRARQQASAKRVRAKRKEDFASGKLKRDVPPPEHRQQARDKRLRDKSRPKRMITRAERSKYKQVKPKLPLKRTLSGTRTPWDKGGKHGVWTKPESFEGERKLNTRIAMKRFTRDRMRKRSRRIERK